VTIVPKRIVVVDDDNAVLLAISANLKADGYDVVPLRDGVNIWEVVANVKPDLIILDILMPEKTGVEILDELRHRFGSLPVIVCSGAREFVPFVEYSSVDAFISKPVDYARLRKVVTELIGPGKAV
jgi:DNA-binding NtrC family response regulator